MSAESLLFLFITIFFIVAYLKTGRKSVIGMFISSSLVFISLIVNDIMDDFFPNIVLLVIVFAGLMVFGSLLVFYLWTDDLEVELEEMKKLTDKEESPDS